MEAQTRPGRAQVVIEGSLQKLKPSTTLGVKRWQTRHFILTATKLTYYKKKGDAAPVGAVDVGEVCSVRMKDDATKTTAKTQTKTAALLKTDKKKKSVILGKKTVFEVEISAGRTYSLAADSAEIARRWVDALLGVMGSARNRATPLLGRIPSERDNSLEGAALDAPITFAGLGPEPIKGKGRWKLLTGEQVLVDQEDVLISFHQYSSGQWGRLELTPYRLIFTIKDNKESLPLGLLMDMKSAKHEDRLPGFVFTAKDFRTVSMFFLHARAAEAIGVLLKRYLFPLRIQDLYAFSNKEKYSVRSELCGWPVYRIDEELFRQGLSSGDWRVSKYNGTYAIPQIPNHFIVPASFPEDEFARLGKGPQAWQRWITVLCWANKRSDEPLGCLLRAYDPASAVTTTTSASTSSPSGPVNRTRPIGIAEAKNMVEHVLQIYPQAAGIHVYHTHASAASNNTPDWILNHTANILSPSEVENSLLSLAQVVNSFVPPSARGDATEFELGRLRSGWLRSLHSTRWMEGVQRLLETTYDILNIIIKKKEPVIIPGSDSTELTPAISSLVQLCLDPYYRTIAGFCFLIEKEWMAFAHKWGQYHKDRYQPKQYSYIFVQFMDAVWQIWDSNPVAFEFDVSMLYFILESVYSARFGSFFAERQSDRLDDKLGLAAHTLSVWSSIDCQQWDFGHSLYDRRDASTKSPIFPQPKSVKFWADYFLKWACHAAYEKAFEDLNAWKEDKSTQELTLCHRGLCILPPQIGDEECFGKGITSLDLSHNLISTLPFRLSNLRSLEKLNLSNNLLGNLHFNLLSSLRRLSRLTHLDLSYNQIADLSAFPSRKMSSLVYLNLSYNALDMIPYHLGYLNRLQELDVAGNALKGDPGTDNTFKAVRALSSLTKLSLANNAIGSVSSRFFERMPQIQELDLTECALILIESGIIKLSKLRVLRISKNSNLRKLPSDLWDLTSLQELHARSSLATNHRKRMTVLHKGPPSKDPSVAAQCILPLELGKLTQLKLLDVSDNSFTSIPPQIFSKMTSLRKLWLSGNDFTSLIGVELSGLSSLKKLDLSRNRLSSLPPGIASLKKLKALSIEDNSIAELPAQLGSLPLEELKVGNQNGCIRSPPHDILSMGHASIMSYLNQLMKGQEPCFRMKVMFVGQENVGKTSLLHALKRKERRSSRAKSRDFTEADFVPLSTDGIEINKWMMTMPWGPHAPQIELSAWDFAGQEIYYATHRFFLSERSLYLAIFNLLSPDQSRIEYWLHSVRSAAGNSPVFLVGTHAEDERCTDEYLSAIRARLAKRYNERFPNVVGIHFVSSTNGKGIDQLYAQMQEVVGKQEHIGQPLPSNYMQFEKILANQSQERMPPMIPWSEYSTYARLCLIETEQDLLTATSLLHNFGSIVHFPNDEKLKDVVILDPQWLMDIMSTVFSTKHTYCKNGVLAHSALYHIWRAPELPPEVHPFILSLLERFELSFPIGPYIHKLGNYAQSLRPQLSTTGAASSSFSNLETVNEKEPLYLIPTLLPEIRPTQLAELWPRHTTLDESLFGRFYKFTHVPKGFMGRLIIRLLAFPLAAEIYWRHGVLTRIGSDRILVELVPEDMVLKVILRTELKGEQMSNLSWLIFAAIDSLIKEWYNLEAQVFVPCSHCMGLGLQAPPFLFPLDKCLEAATSPNQSILYCPNSVVGGGGAKPVRLDHIAPDLAMVHLDQHKIELSDLKKEQEIAEGGYASVFKGTYMGEVVAIKELKNGALDDGEGKVDAESRRAIFEEFRHEVWIMSGLAHPNLVRLVGFCVQPPCIVTEFVPGGSLFDFLVDPAKNASLDWILRLKIAKDIAKGCAFLHNTSPPIMHRDLKSPNILLVDTSPKASVAAKLCDFGVSLSADATAARRVDCPVWLAPEILEQKPYTEKADVYSLGVIFWELLTKQQYFGEVRFMTVLEDMIKAGNRPPISDTCIPAYRHLIERCWAQDPNQRPSCNEIVEMISAMIKGVCPEIESYDATAEAEFNERLKAEAELRKQQKERRTVAKQEKMRAMQALSKAAPPSLGSAIKKISVADYTKLEIIEFMEEFLKMRKDSLLRQTERTEESSGNDHKRKEKAESEKKWLDQFLSRLQQDKQAELTAGPAAQSQPVVPAVPVMLRKSAGKAKGLENDSDDALQDKASSDVESEDLEIPVEGRARGASFSMPVKPHGSGTDPRFRSSTDLRHASANDLLQVPSIVHGSSPMLPRGSVDEILERKWSSTSSFAPRRGSADRYQQRYSESSESESSSPVLSHKKRSGSSGSGKKGTKAEKDEENKKERDAKVALHREESEPPEKVDV